MLLNLGKTAWLLEVLPALIRENPTFGDSGGKNQAKIVVINCQDLNTDSAHDFLCSLMETIHHEVEPSLSEPFPDSLKKFPLREDGLERFLPVLVSTLRHISCLSKQPVFFLLDEVQKWFLWRTKDRSRYDVDAIESMRKIFKRFVANEKAPFCHFAFTGSCMALAWINIRKCPPNGRVLSSSPRVNLPAQVR